MCEWVCSAYACYCFIFYHLVYFDRKVVTTTHKVCKIQSTRYGIFFLRSGDILHTHSTRLDSQSTRHRKSSTIALVMYHDISCSYFCVVFVSIEYQNLYSLSLLNVLSVFGRYCALPHSRSVSFHFTRHTVCTAHISISHRFTLTCKSHSLGVPCVCLCVRALFSFLVLYFWPIRSHVCGMYTVQAHIRDKYQTCAVEQFDIYFSAEREWERNFVFIEFALLVYAFVCVQYALPVCMLHDSFVWLEVQRERKKCK